MQVEPSFVDKVFSWSETAMAFWALILGAMSLLIHLIGFLRKALLRATVSFEIVGFPEVGFSNFGPTARLTMLFRTLNKDTFIRMITVTVENQNTHERHEFNWLTFNEFRHDPLGVNPIPSPAVKDIAAGFYLIITNPIKLDILFYDPVTQGAITTITNRGTAFIVETARTLGVPVADPVVVSAFKGSPEQVQVYTDLTKTFYWKEGPYLAQVCVETDEGVVSRRFSFALAASDVRSLELNIAAICSYEPGTQQTFQFAYPHLALLKD